MGIELLKENIDYNQVIGQNTSDTVVKEEYIIPDTQPDVRKILMVDAKPNITNTDIMQDKVYIEGSIEFNVLYLGVGDESSQVCGVAYTSKFSNYVDISGAEHDMECLANAYVEHMNCNIVNERKISVEGIVEISAEIEKPYKIQMVSDVLGTGEIQFLRKQSRIDKLINKSSMDLVGKSNITIPMDKAQIDEILKYDTNIHKKQIKILEGKIQVEAFVNIGVLYRDKESREVNFVSDDVMVTGEEDVEEADPSMDYNVDFEVGASEFSIKEDDLGERRTINSDILVKCDIELIKKEEANIIDDAYSPQSNLKLERQNYDVNMVYGHGFSETIVKENLELEEDSPVPSEVIMCSGSANITDQKLVENKVALEGVINSSVVYRTSDADKYVYALNEEIPFSCSVDIPGSKIDMMCNSKAYIENIEAAVEANTILVKAVVSLESRVFYTEHKDFIVNVIPVEGGAPEKKASVTIYVAQKDDSLWKIAKRYCTTVENIVKANNIENSDEVLEGQKLLIPGRAII